MASGAISARNGRSRNGSVNGIGLHTASDARGRDEESEDKTFDGADEDSLSSGCREGDDDVDMADEPVMNGGPTTEPQEATPSDSLESPAAAPVANPVPRAHGRVVGSSIMDESDMLDDLDNAREEGRNERERDDTAVEHANEVLERSEQ